MEEYYTLAKEGSSLYKVKGSKHLGYALPVDNIDNAKEYLENLRKIHPLSNHVCFAWHIGLERPNMRNSDDGEPSNSAGPPIQGQIERYELRNTLVAVVRYFGGTKLGVGGLIDAYRNAAQMAIQDAEIVKKVPLSHFRLHFSYDRMSEVMYILRTHQWHSAEHIFELTCSLKMSVQPKKVPEIQHAFAAFTDIRIEHLGTY